jgi:hypothetical protein
MGCINLAQDRELLRAVTNAVLYVNLRSDVLAAMNMKVLVFQDVMPCNSVLKYHLFRGIYCLQLHGRRKERCPPPPRNIDIYHFSRRYKPQDRSILGNGPLTFITSWDFVE